MDEDEKLAKKLRHNKHLTYGRLSGYVSIIGVFIVIRQTLISEETLVNFIYSNIQAMAVLTVILYGSLYFAHKSVTAAELIENELYEDDYIPFPLLRKINSQLGVKTPQELARERK